MSSAGEPPHNEGHLKRGASEQGIFWQTFGRLRLRLDQFIRRGRDFFSRLGQIYGARNDYVLSEVTRDGLDTAGVFVRR